MNKLKKNYKGHKKNCWADNPNQQKIKENAENHLAPKGKMLTGVFN